MLIVFTAIGNPCINARVELAWMYAKGIGVEQNSQQAKMWIDNATQVAISNNHVYDEPAKNYVEKKQRGNY